MISDPGEVLIERCWEIENETDFIKSRANHGRRSMPRRIKDKTPVGIKSGTLVPDFDD